MEEKIDEKDLEILEVLKEHGDWTTRKIAKKTLLPPTTIHNRIRKLKESGVIRKYTVDVDHRKLGMRLAAYILVSADVKLLKKQNKTQHDLAKEIGRFPFVERVDVVTGVTDLVALVRLRDVQELDRVLLKRIQLLDGVDKTTTMVIIHEGK
jgi:DNA-binding Lrp family transcriptional regulator